MEYLIKAFGGITIENLAVGIAAIVFLWKICKAVEDYISKKAVAEKEKDERMQTVIDLIKTYPKWQEEIASAIRGIQSKLESHQKTLEKIEEDNTRRERNKLRDRLLQSYRYYTSPEKNPMQAWTETEAEAFWGIFGEYEEAKGDGHVHKDVQPAMRALDVISMDDDARRAALMNSRK